MKISYSILLVFLLLLQTWGGEPLSIEQFDKVTDPAERAKLIESAPPEEKAKLKDLDLLRKALLQKWRDEAHLKRAKESQVARARGLGCLELVFEEYMSIWAAYISDTLDATLKAGATNPQQLETRKRLQEEEDVVSKRLPIVHVLVLNLAPSPAEKKVEPMIEKFHNRIMWDNRTPYDYRPITIQERKQADQQMDEVFAELQALPKLPPEQVQKECDAMTDEALVRSQ
jgi:hypothetical protein